ncbi:MAG: inorganic phosphate transporter [Eubacteriales bacterium]|nr:inorganic phosphate transporter [Eubacteriales bacterium]
MNVALGDFLQQLSNPMSALTAVLTLGVILVNGWTDAPNAIATCVSTRAMKASSAIMMAAVCNFLGVLVMTMINSKVAMTIYNMVDFGGNAREASIALCAALFAIVVWAVAAWRLGIPTSESHALIAGLSGAAIALHSSFSGINGAEWIKVIYGLLLSTGLGFAAGFGAARLLEGLFRRHDRRGTGVLFRRAQIAGGAAMAFLHGAQDGQKFMSVFLLGMFLSRGQGTVTEFQIPLWLMVLCSAVMALGTSIGGYRIIKSVGMDMVRLQPYQGFAADLAAAGCLLFSSLTGIPVSTTHTKTTAVMGVGASRRLSAVDWSIVRDMTLAWVLTFPGCGALGYLVTKLFLRIFTA